eukprot:1160538-Pelagomonas_calceolata.AAC.4
MQALWPARLNEQKYRMQDCMHTHKGKQMCTHIPTLGNLLDALMVGGRTHARTQMHKGTGVA